MYVLCLVKVEILTPVTLPTTPPNQDKEWYNDLYQGLRQSVESTFREERVVE